METIGLISLVVGIVIFIMFWRLCSNIGEIKKSANIISEYTLIKAKKEGLKVHGDLNEKELELAEKLRN